MWEREREREREGEISGGCARDMLCALLLSASTTASELFKSLSDYISGKLNWSFCVSICMDGAAAITGQLSGFTTQFKEVTSECKPIHCVLHREMLASQKCHPFCRIRLKLVTTSKHMPLTHICSHSSVRRWTQSTHISYKQKWDGFLKVDHQPEFLSYENHTRFFFF